MLVPAAQARFELPAIELEITSRCNARCVMCPRPVLREHRGFAHMTPEVFAAVVRNVGGRGVPAYHLCGIGEPLLHPLCLEFAAALRRADPAARIVCVTNGFSLQPERLDALLGSPIDVLEVSLHALDEAVHRSILRSFRVGRALERLEALLARRAALGSSLDVRIGQVLVAPHPTADAELAAWAAGHGLPFATWRAWNRAGHVPEEMVTDDASEPRAFAGTNRSPEVCSDYATMLFIDHRGDVLSCCCDFANETTEGNAAEHSLEALLARRHETLASGQPLSPICERCDAPATNKPFLPTDYFAVARKPLPGGGQEPPNR
ncbi:MAG TPA: radical SAM/SPASM domain-containing protein [Thermoanaerobaculia bacterium]|nr:radical SAM/SPASM domain-containing protein [Thermoanaerobaculia bacterium]